MVSGSCSLENFFETFDLPQKEDTYESITVGGWVMEELGYVPDIGAQFTFEGHQVTVTQVEKRHVKEIQIRLAKPLEQTSESDKQES